MRLIVTKVLHFLLILYHLYSHMSIDNLNKLKNIFQLTPFTILKIISLNMPLFFICVSLIQLLTFTYK